MQIQNLKSKVSPLIEQPMRLKGISVLFFLRKKDTTAKSQLLIQSGESVLLIKLMSAVCLSLRQGFPISTQKL